MPPNATDTADDGRGSGNESSLSESVSELFDWLWERVADDRDVVVDDLQEEQFPRLEAEDDGNADLRGSEEYRANLAALETTIAELKQPGCSKALVMESKKPKQITDGLRKCWYAGTKDAAGRPHGEGMLKYDNGDMFTGT